MNAHGADALVGTLARAGTRQVFTLSGNHVMPVFDAVLDARLPLLHVRHEAAAVHMADAWGRLTGEVGIALVTGGPGHANAVSALYTALMGESPVLLISGHAPLGERGKGAFQEMRQADIAAPVTKPSWVVASAESIAADVARAIRIARSGRPGPVHLSIPVDLLEARSNAGLPAPSSFSPEEKRIPESKANEFLGNLARAKRPLILVGPAMMNARGRQAIERLEGATGVPVIGMESPRGVNDPSLGRLAEALRQADAVVLLGKRLDFTLKFGRAFGADAQVVEAGEDIDALASCERLAAQAPQFKWTKGEWREEVQALLRYRPAEWKEIIGKEAKVRKAYKERKENPIHPLQLCREVQKLLDVPEAVLVADGGEIGQWAQACLSAPHRVINGPAGSIGSALPFAAAAKLAFPRSPVIALMGDGTFGFHASEVDTAVRYGLPYVAVIGNDACWNAEHQIQLRAYGRERTHGLDLLPTRYGAVAAAFGGHGEDVSSLSALPTALQRASDSQAVSCVNVFVERLPAPAF